MQLFRQSISRVFPGGMPLLAVLVAFCIAASDFRTAKADTVSTPSLSRLVDDAKMIEFINAQIRQGWQEHGLRRAEPATDSEWLRRVYLDLVGRIPSVNEVRDFVQDRSPHKRSQLVDRLLGSEYQETYANYWSTYWSNALIGRTGGRRRQDLTSREGMRQYLLESLHQNKPYDQFAMELITAEGSTDPDAEDFNGAVNFLVEKLSEDAVQATAKTARIFLGTAVECTQCHNHPFNEYRQNQFWELNAFFRQARVDRIRDPDPDSNRRTGRLENRDFAGEGRSRGGGNRREVVLESRDGKLVDRQELLAASAPIYYELRNGQMQVAYPVFIDGTTVSPNPGIEAANETLDLGRSGMLEHVDRRQALSEFMVSAREFDRSLVNRMWAHFFGYGFTRPYDDMGPHNIPSHPELLEGLGEAFRASGFDVKALQRWIVLSEPYSLSSKVTRGNAADEPIDGAVPQFSRFYVRQMQPEQLFDSLLIATAADETVADDDRDRVKDRWLQQFFTAYGTDDDGEASLFNGSIPQVLTMMNGQLIQRACRTDNGSFLDQIAKNPEMNNRQKINHLYLAALSRRPTRPEINVCNELLISRSGNVVGSLQDIWWAMLNSNEFILIH